ncbi:MAG TPA: RHS repeat-associated core domain-containing protein [Anaerolineae bacterium]|nr:RHS repeat-associated core domain-containing protein [Anaerolineae bacterium]
MVKYYYAGGQRVAMRQGSSAPIFLLGDHLGSTSKTYNTANGATTEQRYTPWGGTRSSSSPTSFQYTGQRKDATGLYFYNARYYDPYLNRFLSPDTIVPDPTNPQSLNRYSYVLNNPLGYTDPTGHRECGEYCDPNEITGSNQFPLYTYGLELKDDASLTPLDRLQLLLQYATGLYDFSDPAATDQFMIDITAVIHGYVYPQQGRFHYGTNERNPYWLGHGGFDPDYNGGNPCRAKGSCEEGWSLLYADNSGNQAFHFWYYVAEAYFDGRAIATVGNFLHDGRATSIGQQLYTPYNERFRPTLVSIIPRLPPMDEWASIEDFRLGQQGIYLGTLLHLFRWSADGIHPDQLGEWIQVNLGD